VAKVRKQNKQTSNKQFPYLFMCFFLIIKKEKKKKIFPVCCLTEFIVQHRSAVPYPAFSATFS